MAGKPRIFIDGESGTTGLQIRARLEGRSDLAVVSIDPARRKDADERKRLLNEVDLAVLCLPDQAARDAVAWIVHPPPTVQAVVGTASLVRCRPMTIRWIWLVPSKIWKTFASRM